MDREGRKSAIPHIGALDGARGAAVAGVLLFHGGHLLGGYLGVDFFFTLSGFLITSLLLAEATRTGSVGLGGFWARRARRLLPALAVLMVGIALYCLAFADPTQLAQIRGDALATLAYAANWRAVFARQDYWSLFSAPSPLQHTWSLAIEEQFYVIWPLLFFGLLTWWKQHAARAVLVASLALASVSSVLMIVWYDPFDTNRVYYGTDTRACAILLGAALAAWLAMRGPVRSRGARTALEAAGLAGAGVLAIAWIRLDGQSRTLYHGGFLVCGLAATAVIAAAVHPQPGFLARALSVRPLRALGWISYGVYLYHWPIDVVLDRQRAGYHGWPLFVIQTTVTLGIAIFSYRVIEQPIRHGALTSAQWRRFTPAIAIGLVALIFVSAFGAHSFVPASALPGDHPVAAAALARKKAPPGARRILIIGDSEANFLTAELESLDVGHRFAVFDAANAGCTVPPGISRLRVRLPGGNWSYRLGYPCDKPWEAAAIAQFRPQVVIWIVTNPYEGMLYRGKWITPCAEPYNTLYSEYLRLEFEYLSLSRAHIVATTTAYWRPTEKNVYFGIPDTKLLDHYADCDNRLRRQIAAQTGAQLVDLFQYVCPDGKCRLKQEGATLRPDGVHYAGPGGRLVTKWMISQISALRSG